MTRTREQYSMCDGSASEPEIVEPDVPPATKKLKQSVLSFSLATSISGTAAASSSLAAATGTVASGTDSTSGKYE